MKTLIVVLGLASFAQGTDQAEKPVCPTGPPKQISIKQGEYSPRPGTTIRLENFLAKTVPQSQELPFCFKNLTLVDSGSITLDSASISKLFNDKAGADSKMKDLKISTKGGNLSVEGSVHKIVQIHFQLEGPVKPAQHGDVRMQVESIHAAGMPIKGVMQMFGSDLGSMMGSTSARGISVENNTVIFHTEQLMNFRGEITAVHLLKDGVKLDFGPGKQEHQAEAPKPPVKAAHADVQPAAHRIR